MSLLRLFSGCKGTAIRNIHQISCKIKNKQLNLHTEKKIILIIAIKLPFNRKSFYIVEL